MSTPSASLRPILSAVASPYVHPVRAAAVPAPPLLAPDPLPPPLPLRAPARPPRDLPRRRLLRCSPCATAPTSSPYSRLSCAAVFCPTNAASHAAASAPAPAPALALALGH